MACNTLANRYEPCKEFVGGLKGVFLVPFTFSDVVTKDASNLVTSINDGAASPTNVTGYFWELKGLSTLETTATASRDNGNTFYQTVLTLSFKPSGKTATTGETDNDLFNQITQGRWRVIVWDRNDQFWLIGETLGVDASAGTSAWGVQMGDARLHTITMDSMEPLLPSAVDAASYSDVESVITIAS